MFLVVMIPIGIAALSFVGLTAVAVYRGKMPLEAGALFIFGTLFVAVIGAVKMGLGVIDANTAEDTAKIAAGKSETGNSPDSKPPKSDSKSDS